ncbi:hypothetical protein Tco_0606338 [Tanacetum coccineum]
MHQPWRTFTAVINRCISGKSPGLDRLRLSRAQILWGINPQRSTKFKKPASHSKKKTFVKVKEEELEPTKKDKPTKKPTTKRQSSGVQIQDTPKARRKGTQKSKRETTIIQAGGSSEGADFESVVPDEPKGKSTGINEGTGTIPDSLMCRQRINLKRVKTSPCGKWIYDNIIYDSKMMTVMMKTSMKVMMIIRRLMTERIESDEEEEESQDDENVHTPTTSTTVVSESETLAAFHSRITNLVKDVKDLKMVDHSEVPNAVKEYLGTSLDDALYKVLKKHDADIIKEHSVPDEIIEIRRHQYVPKKCTEHSENQDGACKKATSA